jgi:hypothetical protein
MENPKNNITGRKGDFVISKMEEFFRQDKGKRPLARMELYLHPVRDQRSYGVHPRCKPR